MSSTRPFRPDLRTRVAIVTGASRGIGRATALALAECGCAVVVAAKTAQEDPRLPGTIYTVVEEIRQKGGRAMAYQLDVRNEAEVQRCVDKTVETFGTVDIVVNNASALWWRPILDTPVSRFDLMMGVNARGSYALTRAALPHMIKGGWGHVICMSPPLDEATNLAGRVAYSITKMGMTIVALGVAAEFEGKGIAGNALWPATLVESSAVENFQMGERSQWRKADVLADAVLCLLSKHPNDAGASGIAWEDEELLRANGATDEMMATYRCDPNVEPPTMRQLAGREPRIFDRGRAMGNKNKARSKL